MRAIRIHEQGEPEVMRLEELPTPEPGPGQALVKVAACGVNFVDIYQRSGLYKLPLPLAMGREGAGTVVAVGQGVSDFLVEGERVGWAGLSGSYADYLLAPADRLVPLPPETSFEQAAALMLQGMTAQYLSHAAYPLQPGHTCLIHAAAGGVGQLLVQMAKLRGARVFGTVSNRAKAETARQAGADEAILYTQQDFEAEVKRLTDGSGVEAVYDSVGKDTFEKSLNCLKPRGYLVLFGTSSGPVAPVDPSLLMSKGSLFLTRPSLDHYTRTRLELLERARDVLGWAASGRLKVRIERSYPLEQAAEAHRALASRQTSGKLLLVP